MDPLTLLAAAKLSFEAVKSGIAVAKDVQAVAADLGSLFESIAAITRAAAEPPRGSLLAGKSAQQMAIEAMTAKLEADQLMADLKNSFVSEYGLAAWDQVLSATTQIKKQQKADALQAEKEQEQFFEALQVWGIIAVVTVLVISLFIIGLLSLMRH